MKIHEKHDLKNAELPFIYFEQLFASRGHLGWSNWHENIEIIQVTEGTGIIINDMEHLQVSKGDIVVINSNHLHAFGSSQGNKIAYRCLIVDRSFGLSNGFDTNHIAYDIQFRDERLDALIEEISKEWNLPEPGAYHTLKIRTLFLQIMNILCLEHSSVKKNEEVSRVLSCIKQALEFIHANYDQNISLDNVADFVKLNKYYFAHEFHTVTGYSFVAYVNKYRCNRAKKQLLNPNLSIKEIAQLCGFESSSYFARVFTKYEDISPGKYRASLQKNNKR